MPLLDPALNVANVIGMILDYYPGQGMAPFPMPPAVFVERIKDLTEQIIALAQGEIAKVVHKYLVHEGLEHEVQSDERFRPVVTDEQFFKGEAQRLPERIALPARSAIDCEIRIKVLKLPDPVGNALHAAHFVCRLQGGGDDNASARGHLSDISSHHLEAVARISQRSNDARKNMQPLRRKLAVVTASFDLVENAVDENFLVSLKLGV